MKPLSILIDIHSFDTLNTDIGPKRLTAASSSSDFDMYSVSKDLLKPELLQPAAAESLPSICVQLGDELSCRPELMGNVTRQKRRRRTLRIRVHDAASVLLHSCYISSMHCLCRGISIDCRAATAAKHSSAIVAACSASVSACGTD
jgi:hypothetical protein